MTEISAEQLLREMVEAFALHEVICTPAGEPVDYRYLRVNPAFETLSGLQATDVVGKTVRELFPDIDDYWIKTFGAVALTGRQIHFERFSCEFGRHLEVKTYRPAPGQFACLFIDVSRRNQAEAELHENQTLLNHVQGIAHIGYWTLDLASHQLFWSDEVYRIFGLAPQEFASTYEAFLDTVHPDDRAAVDAAYSDSLLENKSDYEIEHRIIRRDNGEVAHVNERCLHERDTAGMVIRSIGIVQDISARKQIEKSLQETASRLHKIMNTCGEWIWETDLSGNHIYSNDAILEILGYSPEEIVDRPYSQLLHEEDLVHVTRRLPQLIKEQQGWQGWALRWQHKDGSYRWLESNAEPVVAADGKVTGFCGVDRDVTARIQAETALRESEKQLNDIVTFLSQPIYEADLNGRLTFANRAAFTLFGYSEEDYAAGLNVLGMVIPEDVEKARERIGRLLQGSEEGSQEYTARRKDGSTFPVIIYSSLVKKNERPIGLKGLIVDITARKEYEQELELARDAAQRANRAKDEFLANMSHELRTPLTSIRGFAELLEGTELSPRQRDYLSTISSSTETLLGLVNDLLDIAKIEAGKLELQRESFALRGMLKQLVDSLMPKSAGKGLTITTRIAEETPDRLIGSPLRLSQILLNLLNNAIKFTSQGGISLDVSAEQRQDHEVVLCFAVSDSGIGIKESDLARIFEPFSQIDPSLSRKFGGVGLGLAISRQLTNLMGGTLTAESHPGVGSTFRLRIPLTLDETGQETTPLQSEEPPSLRPEKSLQILLAEDSLSTQQLILAALKRLGHHVDVAGNGDDALTLWAKNRYDLILMDVQMPLVDGIEAVKRLRLQEQACGGHTPVIALTAHALEDDRREFLRSGFDGYVAKPMRLKELAEAIAKVLDQR